MKIKELLESISEVKRFISEIRINECHFKSFEEIHSIKGFTKCVDDLEVRSWKVSVECYEVILIIHAEESEEPEDEDREEDYEEDELTVGDVLSSICFDDENTIVIYNRNNGKIFDSDEDGIFALCELLCLDVREYAQIHRGNHQTIEIYTKFN